MECELLRVQITLTDSGQPRTWLYEKSALLPRQRRERLFQKEHLVIFFNPLQLEIRNTIIKLQLLWLPTFAPATFSEALALLLHQHPPPTFQGVLLYCCTHSIGPTNVLCSAHYAAADRRIFFICLFTITHKLMFRT